MTPIRRTFLVACLVLWPAERLLHAVDFAREVQPILERHCVRCHGAEKQKGGYRVDARASAVRGGDSGQPAIVEGKSAASPLVNRIAAAPDSEERMPPKGEQLSAREIALVRSWIDAGALWSSNETAKSSSAVTSQHWSFQPIRRPLIPNPRRPRWVRNPIDSFVLHRLEREKLKPSAEADRSVLIRRLHLDLLGLLPSPKEVETFIQDQRPDAYERLVDELLASPHFGERWARHWLDLARYADSAGYQIDRVRPGAYLYRDWVINAFNRDLPFDQFTVEQLAGDLLPDATAEQRIATGFHRMTLSNLEDGVDAAEYDCKAKVDRVATTGTAWLGLTLGCAECHTHKYDPITQREFFQLYAFFNEAEEADFPIPQSGKRRAEEAMQLRARTNAPPTFVHLRGDFLNRGERVEPGVPRVLNEFPAETRRPNRLDLARWIVAPENPLTARVAVNHFWLHLFGRGLVNTPEDFGTRGDAPSHPELLDWLASEFQRRHWSRKEMIRLMVTSATYRQASVTSRRLEEKDPENVLLARQNRLRVESEIVRDLFLDASGLLQREIGGPSIYPPIPEDVKAAGYGVGGPWVETQAPEKYRRGLYVANRRTVPYPVAMTFDQANANECVARRERSNTPLQPLALLNNPFFVECTEALGKRLAAAPGDRRTKLSVGFRLCLGRSPAKEELRRLEQLVASVLQQGHVTEDQAWRLVAEVLVNLDEFLTRE